MNNIYTASKRATLFASGSSAKTPKGIARAIIKFGSLLAVKGPKLKEPWRLDRLTVGSPIQLDCEVEYGYRWATIKDDTAAVRAEKAIGKGGKRVNYSAAVPIAFGACYHSRLTPIRYLGAWGRFTGSHLHRYYQSCVGITRSGRSALVIRECAVLRRIIAPAGMKFDYDHLGPFLKRLSDGFDYHLTAEDWKAKDFATRCRQQMAKNWSARAAANRVIRCEEKKNKDVIKSADRRGVRVGFADSIRAGNCSAGTIRFCSNHYLNIRKFYAASELMRMAKDEAQRVRLAVGCAIRRHDSFSAVGAEVFYPGVVK